MGAARPRRHRKDTLEATIIWAALAAIVGGFAGWAIATARASAATARAVAAAQSALQVEAAELRERARHTERELAETKAEFAQLEARANAWREALDQASNEHARLEERSLRVPALEAQLRQLDEAQRELAARLARSQSDFAALQARAEAERASLEAQAKFKAEEAEALAHRFKALAQEIFDEKSKAFRQQSAANLEQVLEPLRTRLNDFRAKVEEVYVQEGKDRSALAGQVQQLVELNRSLSEDAQNLTRALRGSSKAQGNWGELILERVLEASGLRRGFEYEVQSSETRDDGSRAQPDVVIHLPEERKLVVDAKVSLTAYERLVSAESDAERAACLKGHLESVRSHIRGLSERQYEALYGIKSLDFVLAFVPVEPAFMVAVTNDEELFMDAWRMNVLLVSPSTLLFVVRTVAHLWRQEAQKNNYQEIARRGGELYDKLCGFVEDLQDVGSRLDQAQKSFERAQQRLHAGRGNVIRQAEMLRELGVKSSKSLPDKLVELSKDDPPATLTLVANNDKPEEP